MSTKIVRHRPQRNNLTPFDSSLGNFFEDFWSPSPFFHDPFFTSPGSSLSFSPSMDVSEEDNKFIAKLDLPGFDPDEISVEIEDNALIVHGNRESSSEDNSGKYLRNERVSGSFYQKLQFPSSANLEAAECSSKNGVLTIEIPKREESKRKSLKVKLLK